MQATKQSRADLFTQLERLLCVRFPSRPYEVGIWSMARVHLDYHIDNDDRFYSVPYTLLKQEVEVREAGNVVEIFHKGERVASHARLLQKYARSTHAEHMPPAHKEVARWSTLHLLERASRCGPQTLLVAEAILAGPSHPELGYRSCLGLLRLWEKYGTTQMETVCQQRLRGMASYRGVKALLASGKHSGASSRPTASGAARQHSRGGTTLLPRRRAPQEV